MENTAPPSSSARARSASATIPFALPPFPSRKWWIPPAPATRLPAALWATSLPRANSTAKSSSAPCFTAAYWVRLPSIASAPSGCRNSPARRLTPASRFSASSLTWNNGCAAHSRLCPRSAFAHHLSGRLHRGLYRAYRVPLVFPPQSGAALWRRRGPYQHRPSRLRLAHPRLEAVGHRVAAPAAPAHYSFHSFRLVMADRLRRLMALHDRLRRRGDWYFSPGSGWLRGGSAGIRQIVREPIGRRSAGVPRASPPRK